MPHNAKHHHRRSLRLPGYDYRTGGAYFVTICTQHHKWRFGTVTNDTMIHNSAGDMVCHMWLALPEHYPAVHLDLWVLMPNHLHGIVWLRAIPGTPTPDLGTVIGGFKSLTTRSYITGVHDLGWEPFDQQLWQRNYYEHIVRNEDDLNRIRDYIQANPVRWMDDPLR